jgi:hypothetical protein
LGQGEIPNVGEDMGGIGELILEARGRFLSGIGDLMVFNKETC